MTRLITAIICIFLAGCATVNTKSDNPATVSFQIKDTDDVAVLTFWRKRQAGKRGSAFPIGVNRIGAFINLNFPPSAPVEEKLDPGLYYLDSFQVSLGDDSFYLSQSGLYFSRNGWDDENDRPLYLAFTVNEGQRLILPVVTVAVSDDNGIISHSFQFSDPKHIFIVGERSNINKKLPK